jgi:uncharacterized protein (DUF305 family)
MLWVLVCAMLLAGCARNGDTAASVGDHNSADQLFAQRMALHHQQAVDVAAMVEGRTFNTRVVNVAAAVKQARQAELPQLDEWVARWGTVPGVSIESTAGRMSAEDLRRLGQRTSLRFDSMWLDLMITHHRGAIEMAGTELAQGVNADARAFAQHVIDTQQAELDQMQGMTGG